MAVNTTKRKNFILRIYFWLLPCKVESSRISSSWLDFVVVVVLVAVVVVVDGGAVDVVADVTALGR